MKTWLGRTAWLVLAAAAGLSSWLLLANHGAKPRAQAAIQGELPDYSLRDAVVTRYAASGARRYVLHSKRITHHPAGEFSILTDIGLDYYPESSPYWHLSADHGRLSHEGNRVALAGDVRARQPAAVQPLHLATSRLKVRLQEHRISSDVRVTLWQGARETQGTGLSADLRKGTVTLLKDVTSRYVQ